MDELKAQIAQMRTALAAASSDDKPGLQMMIEELESLLVEDHAPVVMPSSSFGGLSAEEEEFRLFQEEIAALESTPGSSKEDVKSSSSVNNNEAQDFNDSPGENTESQAGADLENELAALEGMKCKAPFEHHWGQVGYYNGIVLSVEGNDYESLDSILVRVMFSQPVSESMLPCPFYMESKCRFEGSQCKFSHGEVVSLAQLKEYVEPDFTNVGTGSRVLAKYTDGLWYKATISDVYESGNCEIKYDSYENTYTIPLHETSPMFHDDQAHSSSSSDYNSLSSDSEESSDEAAEISNLMFFQMKATTAPLGEWEKHTRGMGSKLMAKMGYVLGTGLGKRGEGRVEPVDAVILPPGRSLDACMELKEKAGNGNIFSADKRLKRQKKKEAQRAEKEEARKKENESVFNFLNTKLSLAKAHSQELRKNIVVSSELNKETSKNLNKKMLNLGENIKQVTKDIARLKESMKRHEGRDKNTADKFKLKLESMESHLIELRKSELTVESEQRNRNDKKKLAKF